MAISSGAAYLALDKLLGSVLETYNPTPKFEQVDLMIWRKLQIPSSPVPHHTVLCKADRLQNLSWHRFSRERSDST